MRTQTAAAMGNRRRRIRSINILDVAIDVVTLSALTFCRAASCRDRTRPSAANTRSVIVRDTIGVGVRGRR